ncbi:preprotein translocase subunit SecA [candidate division TA06 bacterium]|nr:preprotein translocase subunit SecA [candidate division TA06 bacterium]
MFGKIFSKVLGSKNERELKKLHPMVEIINREFEKLKNLTDEELPKKTEEFKSRLAQGETLDDLLPEAFALVKETCRRLLGKSWSVCDIETAWAMVPFDVQLMGAVILHQGKIAEMATGEGKTLVATMPLYLNALAGKGAHLITVNDYLARRDREWMGKVYEFLGLTLGCIHMGMEPEEKREQYHCDITYGTNNEFGFDFLRDNMAIREEDQVQRGHYYAIVDEVDSVLVDEARTPLIISGSVEHSTQQFDQLKPIVARGVHQQTLLVNQLVAEGAKLFEEGKEEKAGLQLLQARRGAPKNKRLLKLEQEQGVKKLIERTEMDLIRDKKLHELDEGLFFAIDEKGHTVDITEKGRTAFAPKDPDTFIIPDLSTGLKEIDDNPKLSSREKAVEKENLYRAVAEKTDKVHSIQQLLKAYSLYEKDVEYVLQDGKVLIVDEFTGRLMPGRRYSEGLHQAIEAKEGVRVEGETQTFATITLQNYFRMYEKLAGMTGTAETEAHEFWEIYKLDVVVAPTHKPMVRKEFDDVIYKTRREKYNAVINEIEECHKRGQPVLVGTVTVDVSETLSRMLKRRKIPHSVLNAKQHQKEAEIVAHAGEFGRVTIATNMAGRGTDIKLGKGVVEVGGLHILGTGRHEARRIDRQLRGRSGRQGDPGSSRFYLSLEDDLMRLFGSDRISGVMDRMGVQEGEAIEHRFVTKAIANAQKRVEGFNFDIRKRLLEYDDVMNKQREVIYDLRNETLRGGNLKDRVIEIFEEVINRLIESHTDPKQYPENWDWEGLRGEFQRSFLIDFKIEDRQSIQQEDLRKRLLELVRFSYERREEEIGTEALRELERRVVLFTIDARWRDHLYEIDSLKEGIGLRGYAQKDPLVEYKHESFKTFEQLLDTINNEVTSLLYRIQVKPPPESRRAPAAVRAYKPEAVGARVAAEATQVMAGASPRGRAESAEGGEEPLVQTFRREAPKVGRNDPCPCGSGKKFKKCHGRGE